MDSSGLITQDALRLLWWTAAVHLLVGAICLLALGFPAPRILGVHPALKPLKFALSIALFLGTIAVLLPMLSVTPETRAILAWLFALTMILEMTAIGGQALRGTTSHFNVQGPFNTTLWNLMGAAIVVATIGIGWITVVASFRPMVDARGDALAPLFTVAWRVGLWLLLLSPVSGFAMGSRLRHSVRGDDGGAGLPLVNWSVQHGDLRVAHFFALHAVQVLPSFSWLLLRMDLADGLRMGILATAIGMLVVLCIGTLWQALSGRPVVRRRSPI